MTEGEPMCWGQSRWPWLPGMLPYLAMQLLGVCWPVPVPFAPWLGMVPSLGMQLLGMQTLVLLSMHPHSQSVCDRNCPGWGTV